MLTIYGVYRSRASRNFWLAEELALPFAHVPVIQAYRLSDPLAADAPLNTLSPAFLALSPAGAVPCIDDDGFVLTESLAINLYLAKKTGGPLAPRDAREEALTVQWALHATTSVEGPALAIQFAHGQGRAETAEGRTEIDGHAAKLRRPFAVLEAHLAAEGHMVGRRFTVADINTAEVVRYAQGEEPLMAEFPALKAWLESCQARPAFKAMWEKRAAEPA